jgi:very-short-patch-repair endonuclease
MKKSNIVTGQKVSPTKLTQAKEFRQNMTPAERRLWKHLRANRLDGWHFRRQQIIDGFIVDFYCHKEGLVIEVDGPIHKRQKDQDAIRTEILEAKGLKIVRFTNKEVMNDLHKVLQIILENLETDSPFPEEHPKGGEGIG